MMITARDVPKRQTTEYWNTVNEQIAQKEIMKCGYSFEYFVDQFVSIRDKITKRWIPFTLWDDQRRAADLFETQERVVVLKARQLGLSWLAQAYAVYSMLFDPIAEILIFSKTEDEAIDFLERMRGIYELLPDFMQAESIEIDQKKQWKLSNGSRASALAGTRGDSYAATLIIFDEADHTTKDFGEMYQRAEPTADGGGKIFVISTSNKDRVDSLFKNMFNMALEGNTSYAPLFIPWHARPDRTAAWYERTKTDYMRLYGSLDDFFGSYPANPSEALSAREINRFFPSHWIGRAHDDSSPLHWVGRPDYPDPPDGIPNYSGLILYELPRPNVDYVLGADTAEGLETSDESVIHVFEVPAMIEVAHYSAQLDPIGLARLIADVATFYNNALCLVERNNHGHATISKLQDIGRNRLGVGIDGRHGWQTNPKSKAMMFDWSFDLFRDNEVVLRTLKTVNQLKSIERTLKAPKGLNDDCAISAILTITAYVYREYSTGSVTHF